MAAAFPIESFLMPIISQAAGSVIGGGISRATTPAYDMQANANMMREMLSSYFEPIRQQGRQQIMDFYTKKRNVAQEDFARRGVLSGGAIEGYLADTADEDVKKAIADYEAQMDAQFGSMLSNALMNEAGYAAGARSSAISNQFDVSGTLRDAISDLGNQFFTPKLFDYGASNSNYLNNYYAQAAQNTVGNNQYTGDEIIQMPPVVNPFTAPRPTVKKGG